ncbi:PcfJ domain-containing protein [Sinorhizobium meliloti]|uniref:PcfJ domain-containing protein n=1 Tax=Rhizobium meliloti TaxID=382 RepID=UPI00398CE923
MTSRYDHPEYCESVFHLICALDIPDRVLMPIRNLVGCSLGRIFWLDWLRQDSRDAEWMPTPGDHEDPEWHRIDGWPERGDGAKSRKWNRRAALWMQWNSIDAWHVCDWLITATAEGHPWLANVDAAGHPKKLMKCGSLERLVFEATKGLRQRNLRDIILGPEDENFVLDLGAGHTLVQLLSRASLRKEGLHMHHCIGHGGYDELLDDPDVGFYSVRTLDGKPIATIEIRDSYIRQYRGPANAEPSDAVKELVAVAIDAFGWRDWRDRPRPACDEDYGEEALAVLRNLPPARRRPG